jgi:hypothetical protein
MLGDRRVKSHSEERGEILHFWVLVWHLSLERRPVSSFKGILGSLDQMVSRVEEQSKNQHVSRVLSIHLDYSSRWYD